MRPRTGVEAGELAAAAPRRREQAIHGDAAARMAERIELVFRGRDDVYLVEKPNGAAWLKQPRTRETLVRHLYGEVRIGVAADPARAPFVLADFDGKPPRGGGREVALAKAQLYSRALVALGLPAPLVEVSRSGAGFHVWTIFTPGEEPTLEEARQVARAALRACGLPDDGNEAKQHAGIFPHPPGRKEIGRAPFLPWAGVLNGRHGSLFVDPESGEVLDDQFGAIASLEGFSKADVLELLAKLPPDDVKPTARPSTPLPRSHGFDGTLSKWAESALHDEIAKLRSSGGGPGQSRHVQLFASACALFEIVAGESLPDALIVDELRAACESNGLLPDRAAEFERTIEDARERGQRNPRAPEAQRRGECLPVARGGQSDTEEEPAWVRDEEASAAPEGSISDPGDPEAAREPGEDLEDERATLPDSCWRDGFAQFREAYSATTEASDAFFWATYFVAGALMLGRNARKSGGARVYANPYVALVGASGRDRKTTAQDAINPLVAECDESVVVCSGVGSPEALIDALAPERPEGSTDAKSYAPTRRVRALLRLGELSSLLVKGKQDGSRGLLPKLTEAYDCPPVLENRVKRGTSRAEEPFLCVYGSTTPEWLRRDLTLDDIRGGLAGRFIYVTGSPKAPIPDPPDPDAVALQEATKILRAARDRHGVERVYRLTAGASQRWAEWYTRERGNDYANPILDVLAQRLHTNAMKVALVFAALEGTDEISEEQLGAAIDFAGYQRLVLAEVFGSFGETDRGRLERRVLETLRRRGPMPTWGLRQWIRNVSADDLKRAVDALSKVGEIVQRRTKTGRGTAWHTRESVDA